MKNHLVSDSSCQHCTSIVPLFFLQIMSNNVGLTFSVGDNKLWFAMSIEQDN